MTSALMQRTDPSRPSRGRGMRIAVIGTGRVGSALGTGWSRAGHEVIFGSRDPRSEAVAELLAKVQGRAQVMSVLDAATRADVVVLAIPWEAVSQTLPTIAASISGKVLVDCTNPIKVWPALEHSAGSGGEQVARQAPGARVVKAFNTAGFENIQDPKYGDESVSMFYAGDDAGAKRTVRELAEDLGFDPVDVGGLSQAYALEVLASLWGSLAYGQKMGREIGFKLMRRSTRSVPP